VARSGANIFIQLLMQALMHGVIMKDLINKKMTFGADGVLFFKALN